jgi:hypothetical protein
MPLQSAKPTLQVNPQVPPAQVAVAFARTGQAIPQPLQCSGSVSSEISQPLPAAPSQSSKPALQVKPQVLLAQVRDAFAGVGHAIPQPPQ